MSDAMQRNQVPEVTEGYAVSVYPVRWKSYKPDHTRRTGQKGRWQRMTEYCGWENCREAPTVVQSGPEIFNAAPDMMEALEAWRAWSDFEADEPIHESNEDRADWRAEASELYDKAYNLTTPSVAKAKGEQS